MEHSLIVADGHTHEAIVNNKYMGGKYCDFKSYYSHVIDKLDEDSEHVDENIYFRALQKIGAIERGKIINNELVALKFKDKGSKWYPPKDVLDDMLSGSISCTPIYRIKNNTTFGFNCEDPELLHDTIGSRVISLLRKYNDEMKKVYQDVENGKKALKSAGLP
jgi:hypothetical protein